VESGELGKWIERWNYIIRNDREMARECATIALIQLDELISQEFHRKEVGADILTV
jgi:hypothetical protein